jgi:hypothetical protein
MHPSDYNRRKRRILFIYLLLLIPTGLLAKFYPAARGTFIADKFAGLLYVLFWTLLFSFVFVKSSKRVIIPVVFVISCSLEFIQLIHTPLLEYLRSTLTGRLLIGTSFSWYDFLYNAIGSLLSCYFLRRIEKNLLTV